jgi:hypothetical protein
MIELIAELFGRIGGIEIVRERDQILKIVFLARPTYPLNICGNTLFLETKTRPRFQTDSAFLINNCAWPSPSLKTALILYRGYFYHREEPHCATILETNNSGNFSLHIIDLAFVRSQDIYNE